MRSTIRTPRRWSIIGLAAAFCLALAGCGSAGTPAAQQSAGASASAGGSLTLYNGRSAELISPLLDEFTRDTGIGVEVRSANSGELAAQLLTEGDASPADVFLSQDAGALGALTQAGLFAPLPEEILERVPQAYRAQDGTWTGLSGRVRVLVVNPTLVSEAPDTIDELVAGQHADGAIGFAPANASWQSFVTGLRVLRGEDGARQWLERFRAQDPVAYEGNSQVRDAVDSGEVSLGLVNHYYLHELIAERGRGAVTAQNQYLAAGDPGGLVNVAGAGVLTSTDQQAAAVALIDYLSSPKAQAYFAEKTFEYPLVAGVAAPDGLPSLESLGAPAMDLSQLESLQQTQALLAEVGLLTP